MGDSWGLVWSLLRHTMACVGVSCSGLVVEASVTPHKAVERKGGREGGREGVSLTRHTEKHSTGWGAFPIHTVCLQVWI